MPSWPKFGVLGYREPNSSLGFEMWQKNGPPVPLPASLWRGDTRPCLAKAFPLGYCLQQGNTFMNWTSSNIGQLQTHQVLEAHKSSHMLLARIHQGHLTVYDAMSPSLQIIQKIGSDEFLSNLVQVPREQHLLFETPIGMLSDETLLTSPSKVQHHLLPCKDTGFALCLSNGAIYHFSQEVGYSHCRSFDLIVS